MLLISEIRKVLMKIGKESNCEEINPWICACENHLTWSATSTSSRDGKVILAKFLSFLDHILDKHDHLENPLFNKCAHEEIEPREWLDECKLSIRLNFYETTQELGRCIWVANRVLCCKKSGHFIYPCCRENHYVFNCTMVHDYNKMFTYNFQSLLYMRRSKKP